MKCCGRSPAVMVAGLLLITIIAALASRSAFPAQTSLDSSVSSVASVSSLSFSPPTTPPMADVDWRSEEGVAVFYFLQRGIIDGYPAPDGDPQKATFRGSEPISRAEVAKLLLNAAHIPITETRNNSRFLDVAEGEWYTPYVLAAAKRGIVQGYPPRHLLFALRTPVTTAEFLKMLTLTFELRERQRHSFRDVPADAWFAPYAGAAWQYGLFPERVDNLQPGRLLARRDAILALYHLFTVKRPRGVQEWFAPNIPGITFDTIQMHEPRKRECPPPPICPPSPKPECSYKVELDRDDCAISCGTLECPKPQSSAASARQQSSAVSSVSSAQSSSVFSEGSPSGMADISISFSAPATVQRGSPLVFVMNVSNAGPARAENVVAGFTVLTSTVIDTAASDPTCKRVAQSVQCSFALDGGASKEVRVVLGTENFSCGGGMNLRAEAGSYNPDPNPTNNDSNAVSTRIVCP